MWWENIFVLHLNILYLSILGQHLSWLGLFISLGLRVTFFRAVAGSSDKNYMQREMNPFTSCTHLPRSHSLSSASSAIPCTLLHILSFPAFSILSLHIWAVQTRFPFSLLIKNCYPLPAAAECWANTKHTWTQSVSVSALQQRLRNSLLGCYIKYCPTFRSALRNMFPYASGKTHFPHAVR